MSALHTDDQWSNLHEIPTTPSGALSNEVSNLSKETLPQYELSRNENLAEKLQEQIVLRELVLTSAHQYTSICQDIETTSDRASYNINDKTYNQISGISWGPDADRDQEAAQSQLDGLIGIRGGLETRLCDTLSKLQFHLGDDEAELTFLIKMAASPVHYLREYYPWKMIATYRDEAVKSVVLNGTSVSFLHDLCSKVFLKNEAPASTLPERIFTWLPADRQNLVYVNLIDSIFVEPTEKGRVKIDIDHDLVKILRERCGPSFREYIKYVAFNNRELNAKVVLAQELLRTYYPEDFLLGAQSLTFSVSNIRKYCVVDAVFDFLVSNPKRFPEFAKQVLLELVANPNYEDGITTRASKGLIKLGDTSILPYLRRKRWLSLDSYISYRCSDYRRDLNSTIAALEERKND